MSNIIPFDSNAKMPAYLKGTDVAALNADLTAHANAGFPVISIKGKVFAIVRDGERKVIPNPKDPDSPAGSIEVVIIKANKGTSKVFYIEGYDPDAEAKKPDCYSNDGVKPDASAEKPQAKTCATCPKNQWGSKITESGKKAKACQDSVRLAVATPDQLNDPYLLRVPPMSIKSMAEMGAMLAKRNIGYNMVSTKVVMDVEAATPKLIFKPVGLLTDEAYAQVKEMVDSEVVQSILGMSMADEFSDNKPAAEEPAKPKLEPEVKASKGKEVTANEAKAAVEKAEKPAKAEAKPAAKDEDPDIELDLSNLSFDD